MKAHSNNNGASDRIQEALADSYRVIVPDLRGHGDSSPATKPMTIPDFTNDVVQLIQHLGLESVVICGYSQGGAIALECLLSHPDLVSSAILDAPLWEHPIGKAA